MFNINGIKGTKLVKRLTLYFRHLKEHNLIAPIYSICSSCIVIYFKEIEQIFRIKYFVSSEKEKLQGPKLNLLLIRIAKNFKKHIFI